MCRHTFEQPDASIRRNLSVNRMNKRIVSKASQRLEIDARWRLEKGEPLSGIVL
jgi:hypothetical protein